MGKQQGKLTQGPHQLDLAQHDEGGGGNGGEEDEEAAVEDGRQVSHLGNLESGAQA